MTPTFFSNLSALVCIGCALLLLLLFLCYQNLKTYNPSATKQISANSNFATWQTYLQWAVLNQLAPSLSDSFVNVNFNFYGKIYSGTRPH